MTDILPVPSGDIAPVTKAFLDKIGEAIGGLARPWQIVRVAKAEAAAAAIKAEGEAKAEIVKTGAELTPKSCVPWRDSS
jgi:hypothetical protein